MNKENNFISVVIYINNNESNIEQFLKKLIKVLKEKFLKFEIICVNDASKDNSIKIIKEFANDNKELNISIINLSVYQGIEMAMNAGIDLSIGDFVYEFDNTIMDYPISTILDIYNKTLEGYDIVNAAPKNNSFKSSKLFYMIFNIFSNNQYKINTESFRILSRRAINRINLINNSIPYRKAIYSNSGLKMYTIKYNSMEKYKTKISKKLKKYRRDTAFDSLILFTDISYKISIILSILMMIITLFMGIYTVFIFISSNPIPGWTTTMLLLSFGFFMVFVIFTIIIKYLSLILRMIFKNSNYLIESIDKLN